jgi:hypothetical protein
MGVTSRVLLTLLESYKLQSDDEGRQALVGLG